MQLQLSWQHWTVPPSSTWRSFPQKQPVLCPLLLQQQNSSPLIYYSPGISAQKIPLGGSRHHRKGWLLGFGAPGTTEHNSRRSRAALSGAGQTPRRPRRWDTSPQAPPTGAGERPESVSTRRRRAPASSILEQGAAPGVVPPAPDPPGFPLPSSPARSSSKERKGAAPERLPRWAGLARQPLPPSSGPARPRSSRRRPAPGPALLEALQEDEIGLRASREEGAQKGFPEFPAPRASSLVPALDHCLPWSGIFTNG